MKRLLGGKRLILVREVIRELESTSMAWVQGGTIPAPVTTVPAPDPDPPAPVPMPFPTTGSGGQCTKDKSGCGSIGR